VVNLNGSAESLFGWDSSRTFPVSVADVTGVDVSEIRETSELEVDGRLFAVSKTPLSDQSSGSVGELLVLYDITAQRQREQQLSVLNRVLWHNLHNEMTVIRGRAETIQSEPDTDSGRSAASIIDASDRLLSIVGNMCDSERVLSGPTTTTEVDLLAVTEAVCVDLRDRYPEANVDVETARSDWSVSTDSGAFKLAVRNLVENAIVHAETATPRVSVSPTDEEPDSVSIAIEDGNPEIPDIERASLRAEQELPLQHGRGLGLWTVSRCVRALDGELRRETDGLVRPRESRIRLRSGTCPRDGRRALPSGHSQHRTPSRRRSRGDRPASHSGHRSSRRDAPRRRHSGSGRSYRA